FYVDPNYFSLALGPHARLKCTDCHIRAEVEVFPHKEQTPVDCARTCHLNSPSKVESRFSHERVSNMLHSSVHGADTLKEANKLLGLPLREKQASCLLCHDEPTFRRGGKSVAADDTPTKRCNTCHDEQNPVDTRHFFWHVEARSKPARNNQDLVRLCALCHSNEAVRAKFNLPDVTVSYLQSFHGKATLLGSQEAANCRDCHVGQLQNAHQMQPHLQPTAPTNPAHLPDTCRTPSCHRSAGQLITTAAVHLDMTKTRGVEYFIACIFILLIVFTFGPSLLMTALKMVQIIVGRRDPEEHHLHHLAEELMAHPQGHEKLQHFNVHQRVQHWFLAITFILLVLTGFPMKFADRSWAAWLIREFGGISIARRIHHIAGALLIFGFFYHIVYVLLTIGKNKRASGRNIFHVLFTLPMMVTLDDLMQMNQLMMYLVGMRKSRPAGSRFNPEEKFEYIGVFWGTFVLGTTGVLMWFNAWTTRSLPGRILTIATLIHTFEAFLALLHVGIVHMVGVIFSPGVFPLSRAMFSGDTPTEELAEGHAGMLLAVEKDLASAAEAEEEAGHG
ncbi:MAG TPA: cytochrome b/b6 domain-containing protein, partial [Tepidisphaeraceae bacterium]